MSEIARTVRLTGLPPVSRRDLLIGGLLASVGIVTVLSLPKRGSPRRDDGSVAKAIPEEIGPYKALSQDGLVLPPEDELTKSLYDEVVARVYFAPGLAPIMAVFAYGSMQDMTLQLHRPSECYPPQGFRISRPTPVPIDLSGHAFDANFLTATRSDRVEQVLYWSRIGDKFPIDRTGEIEEILRRNLRGTKPDGILVRLSIITEDAADARRQMAAFAEEMAGALPPLGRKLLLGD